MSASVKHISLSFEEYLRQESKNAIKHEYVRGCVFAMVGASEAHNKISGNIFSALHAHLKGSRCSTFISDMKVNVEAADACYYPDVMVTCEKFEATSYIKTDPILIVEVLAKKAMVGRSQLTSITVGKSAVDSAMTALK